jgi:hypothetical protein
MTPIIDTHPCILAPTLTMSTPASLPKAFTSLVLGRSANAIELLVPPAPVVHATTNLKARCFDFLADSLIEHSTLYSSAELIAAFGGHIPSSSYNAALEATTICQSIRSAFFSVDHLKAFGFRNNLGVPVSKAITTDLTQRPSSLSYFAFPSTVNPTSIDPRLTSLSSFSFEFWLSNGPAASNTPMSVAKVLQFGTPEKTNTLNPAMTKTDFLALSTAAKSALATNSMTDLVYFGLMDTCGALKTGYLLFHLWLKSERPDLVAGFISFDDANPFEPIKLGGAISDPSDFDASDHGNLTAIIRYYTPYTDTSGFRITIPFALGADVTVNTIFGLPMLCDLDAVISL